LNDFRQHLAILGGRSKKLLCYLGDFHIFDTNTLNFRGSFLKIYFYVLHHIDISMTDYGTYMM